MIARIDGMNGLISTTLRQAQDGGSIQGFLTLDESANPENQCSHLLDVLFHIAYNFHSNDKHNLRRKNMHIRYIDLPARQGCAWRKNMHIRYIDLPARQGCAC
ncbi:hypothetical protein HYR99_06730 [Candidatus Poribacteria bacterium]|nr:hypothetical protein [Candidatus Poribacteria bacterium]